MSRTIAITGIPIDYGQQRRGVDMGPSAIRYAGVVDVLERLNYVVDDQGDITLNRPASNQEEQALRNLREVVEANGKLAERVRQMVAAGRFPLVLGGDHSVAIGTLAGLAGQQPDLGLIWFDAHADVNTPGTSPSGNIHGMPLAASLGHGHAALTGIGGHKPKVKPEHVVIIGARSVDPDEKQFLRQYKIKTYSMHEIDRLGMTRVMEEAISYLKERVVNVHLSVDLDALDPQDAPGVGTPVIGGLNFREANLAMEMLAEAHLITSAEFVEVNPILDHQNQTARTAVSLMSALFGETLY